MKIGANIIHLSDVNSTNDYAEERIKKNIAQHGEIIISDFQSIGRGHSGSVWESEKGKNLMLSIVLFPNKFLVAHNFYLSKFISLAICHFLKKNNVNPLIKWPNDIYSNHKKIAGILIKNRLEGQFIYSSVIGFGININQVKFRGSFDATSLALETGTNFELNDLLMDLIYSINYYYKFIESLDTSFLNQRYLSNLYLLKKEATYQDQFGVFNATLINVKEDGHLCLQLKNGEIREYLFKEVSLLSNHNSNPVT